MKLKLGIIGLGAQGREYAMALDRGLVKSIVLCAVCNRSAPALRWAEQTLSPSVGKYDNAEQMLRSAGIDAVLVCVPHYQHAEYVMLALRYGLHVLCEKPAGVYSDTVKQMSAAAQKAERVYAVMWNLRAEPAYRRLKQILDAGELGEIRRVTWIATDWYRTQAYYDSGGWRATWAGEGGGILMNQCAHNLDMLCWLFGLPKSVRAFCRYGVKRKIEVENDVTAYFEYPNGAEGIFVASTYEFPGTNYFEISGEYGKIVAERERLLFYKCTESETEFNRKCSSPFDTPEVVLETLEMGPREREGYLLILENFADAVLRGEALIASGAEAVNEALLCNAIQLSDWTGRSVCPETFSSDEFRKLLAEKIRNSEK